MDSLFFFFRIPYFNLDFFNMPPLQICRPGPGPLWPVRKYGPAHTWSNDWFTKTSDTLTFVDLNCPTYKHDNACYTHILPEHYWPNVLKNYLQPLPVTMIINFRFGVTMNISVFWDMTPCCLVEVYWSFRGTCYHVPVLMHFCQTMQCHNLPLW
jgi:hypothetical protein